MARGTKKKKEPRVIPGTSDYVVRENAARKQLGVAGLAARNKQVPAAARATARGLLREVTGIDVSRKGVKVDPMGLAMALPFGKVIKAAKVLRAAGKVSQAAALTARASAKTGGKKLSSVINFYERNFDNGRFPVNSDIPGRIGGQISKRAASTSVFPRKTPDVPFKKVGRNTYSQTTAGPARIEYLALKKDYQKVFGKNAKVGSFNPDLASMTSYPGRGTAASTLKRLSSRVDKYLANKKVK